MCSDMDLFLASRTDSLVGELNTGESWAVNYIGYSYYGARSLPELVDTSADIMETPIQSLTSFKATTLLHLCLPTPNLIAATHSHYDRQFNSPQIAIDFHEASNRDSCITSKLGKAPTCD